MEYRKEIRIRQQANFPFWKIRALIKTILLRLGLRKVSFCKYCGIDVRDYDAPDDKWGIVFKLSKNKSVLCWNCYCDFEYLSRQLLSKGEKYEKQV